MGRRLYFQVISKQTDQVLRDNLAEDNAHWLASRLNSTGIPCYVNDRLEEYSKPAEKKPRTYGQWT